MGTSGSAGASGKRKGCIYRKGGKAKKKVIIDSNQIWKERGLLPF